MKSISERSTVVAAKEQISADLAGEAVILNLRSGVYFGLDAVGARIWNLIQNPTKVKDLRDKILEEYDVDAERCERDLLALLNEMAAQGLVEIDNATPA